MLSPLSFRRCRGRPGCRRKCQSKFGSSRPIPSNGHNRMSKISSGTRLTYANVGNECDERRTMKYILMMNVTKASFDMYAKWSKEDLQRNVAFMRAFSKELKDSGEFVATEGLGWPNEAKLVSAGKNGEPITDGVFPESKEFLAGYWIIDVESPEQAYKIAVRASQAPGPGGKPANMPIEVRQVLGSHNDLGF